MGSTVSIFGGSNKKKPIFSNSYALARELGSGAFSVVKLGVHIETGREYAVKIVSKKKLNEEDHAALLTEINILRELDHPHIIKLLETYDEESEFFIVTELVKGGELFDRIVSKAHYTEKEARDLIKLLLETMAYMHEHGIVHRDLKPENLLLCTEDDDTDVKIADFGFAKHVKHLSERETACGTPGYVAPEILRGDKYGTEVDVWSMGVICYVLLAGYPPFYDEDQKRLFKKIKEGRYHFHEEYWRSISTEAMDLIKRMLCVDQRNRWTAAQLLTHPWILMGEDKLVSKDLTGAITVMRKFNARRRLRAAADAVILANRMNRLLGTLRLANKQNEGAQVKRGTSSNALSRASSGTGQGESLTSEADSITNEGEIDEIDARRSMSFDSDTCGDEPSLAAAALLLNDHDLDDV